MSEASICFVISAPSGAGKTTLAEALLARAGRLTRTVSCTTRTARPDERDGDDYFFVTEDDFNARAARGEFLEHAVVHGHRYGTLDAELERIGVAGHDAVLVIDVQGAAAVRQRVSAAVTIFVLPPSREILEARLVGREGITAENRAMIGRRLQIAAHEIAQHVGYDYIVVNDDLDRAAGELAAIVTAERCRQSRRAALAERIEHSFEGAPSLSSVRRLNPE